jgi:hypothetical protein
MAVVKAKPGRYRGKHPAPSDVLPLIEVSGSTLRYDLGKRASLAPRWSARARTSARAEFTGRS